MLILTVAPPPWSAAILRREPRHHLLGRPPAPGQAEDDDPTERLWLCTTERLTLSQQLAVDCAAIH